MRGRHGFKHTDTHIHADRTRIKPRVTYASLTESSEQQAADVQTKKKLRPGKDPHHCGRSPMRHRVLFSSSLCGGRHVSGNRFDSRCLQAEDRPPAITASIVPLLSLYLCWTTLLTFLASVRSVTVTVTIYHLHTRLSHPVRVSFLLSPSPSLPLSFFFLLQNQNESDTRHTRERARLLAYVTIYLSI